MKYSYYPEEDSLYIELAQRPGADVVQLGGGVVVDVDADGVPVGIDIGENASSVVDLSPLEVEGLTPRATGRKAG